MGFGVWGLGFRVGAYTTPNTNLGFPNRIILTVQYTPKPCLKLLLRPLQWRCMEPCIAFWSGGMHLSGLSEAKGLRIRANLGFRVTP